MTSLSIHPLVPNQLVLALGDGTTCLMDRRVTGQNGFSFAAAIINPMQLASNACLTRFKPINMKSKPYKITCVQFNETGTEILVNYSEDYLYLFKTSLLFDKNVVDRKGSHMVTFKDMNKLKRRENEDKITFSSTSSFTPPIKRLRLRGDWSDTGPEARPEGENQSRSTFMNRMSHLFAQWIDESLSSPNERPEADNSPSPSEESLDDSEDLTSPRTPTESLTSAMALCTTRSPQTTHSDSNAVKENEASIAEKQLQCSSDEVALQNTERDHRDISSASEPILSLDHDGERNINEHETCKHLATCTAVHVVEGESDSDDYKEFVEEPYNKDEGTNRHKEELFETCPVMVYQGHRNARTMVTFITCFT